MSTDTLYIAGFGCVTLDPFSKLLGTGFYRFAIDGMGGLVRQQKAGTIEILAIRTSTPGRGLFSRFVGALKEIYQEVRVLEVMNEKLGPALERNGFKKFIELSATEKATGFKWVRESET